MVPWFSNRVVRGIADPAMHGSTVCITRGQAGQANLDEFSGKQPKSSPKGLKAESDYIGPGVQTQFRPPNLSATGSTHTLSEKFSLPLFSC